MSLFNVCPPYSEEDALWQAPCHTPGPITSPRAVGCTFTDLRLRHLHIGFQ